MEIKINLYSVVILLGIVQAIFLSIFFLSGENYKKSSNVIHGILLLCIASTILEIFLGYTGYMQYVWHLADFSESFTLAIAPLFYLLVLSLIYGTLHRKAYLHLISPIVYTFFHLFFIFQPEEVKHNAWVEAFRPELPLIEMESALPQWPSDPLGIRSYHTELGLILVLIYGTLCLYEIVKIFREKGEKFFHPQFPLLHTLRNGTLYLIAIGIVVIAVKATHENDTGDHFIATFISLIIYMISVSVIRKSGFFKQTAFYERKYKTPGFTPERESMILDKLRVVMEEDQAYLDPDFSLPSLARRVGLTVHQLSQLLNQSLGKSFAEFTAEYRIAHAKKLLVDPKYQNVTLEVIAEHVGYSSKSSFNTAFKKLTGKTPSEYRSDL